MFHYLAIACLLGVAAGAPNLPLAGIASIQHDAYPRYGFNYAVSDPLTGDNKAQSEHREGGVVRGSYSLAEPDGTLRVVDYAADPVSGFNAVVKRIGTAAHPQPMLLSKPLIAAPIVPIAPIAPIAPAYSSSIIGLGHGLGGLSSAWGGLANANLGLGLGLGAHGALGLGAHGALGLGYGH